MTAAPGHAGPDHQQLLAAVISMIAQVTGQDEAWASAVTATSALERDLWLDSVEFAALAGQVKSAYGTGADLLAFLSDSEVDELTGLTVGDLVSYIAGSLERG